MRPRIPLFVVLVLLAIVAGCSPDTQRYRAFQTSTIPALLEGVYQGDMTLSQLRQHGNFGIGTFDDVDGEMVLLDGSFHQVRADGRVYRPDLDTKTPFALVCSFQPDRKGSITAPMNYERFRAHLTTLRLSDNVPCAFKITGEFDLVQTRSVPRQTPPYRRLVEATKEQPTFNLERTRGTLVGFWFPQYAEGYNVPGYHLHYLTADGQFGGHVLDCRPRNVKIEIAELPDMSVRLPRTPTFRSAHLAGDRREELHKVEQAPSAPMGR